MRNFEYDDRKFRKVRRAFFVVAICDLKFSACLPAGGVFFCIQKKAQAVEPSCTDGITGLA